MGARSRHQVDKEKSVAVGWSIVHIVFIQYRRVIQICAAE